MPKTVVTFGEIMLRLAPPGFERFLQSPQFVATFGGGEANVAVSLAGFGVPSRYVTVLPSNPIADACVAQLRGFGVDTDKIVRGKGRMGIYYLEAGANQRPSKVVYDRETSAISQARPGDIDWDNAFQDAGWFHVTGITPAISQGAADLALEAVSKARANGPHRFLRPQLPQEPLEVRQDRAGGDARADEAGRRRHRQRGGLPDGARHPGRRRCALRAPWTPPNIAA